VTTRAPLMTNQILPASSPLCAAHAACASVALSPSDDELARLKTLTLAGDAETVAGMLRDLDTRAAPASIFFDDQFLLDASSVSAESGFFALFCAWLARTPDELLFHSSSFWRVAQSAVAGGSVPIAQALADRFGERRWRDMADRHSLLKRAAFHGHAEMVRWLVPFSDPNAVASDQASAMSLCAHQMAQMPHFPPGVRKRFADTLGALAAIAAQAPNADPENCLLAELACEIAGLDEPHALGTVECLWPFIAARDHLLVLASSAQRGRVATLAGLWRRAQPSPLFMAPLLGSAALLASAFSSLDWIARHMEEGDLPALRDSAFANIDARLAQEADRPLDAVPELERQKRRQELTPWLFAWHERASFIREAPLSADSGSAHGSSGKRRSPRAL